MVPIKCDISDYHSSVAEDSYCRLWPLTQRHGVTAQKSPTLKHIVPLQAMTQWKKCGIIYCLISCPNTCLHGGKCSDSRPGRFTLGRASGSHLVWGWEGTETVWTLNKSKTCCTCRESSNDSSGKQTVVEPLYRERLPSSPHTTTAWNLTKFLKTPPSATKYNLTKFPKWSLLFCGSVRITCSYSSGPADRFRAECITIHASSSEVMAPTCQVSYS